MSEAALTEHAPSPDQTVPLRKSRFRSRLQSAPLTTGERTGLRALARYAVDGAPPAECDLARAAQHRLDAIAARLPRTSGRPFSIRRSSPPLAEADTVVALLTEAGVGAARLKGVWIAAALYPDPAMRPMTDVDLLVRPEQIDTAVAALRAAGYLVDADQELDGPSKRLHVPQLAHPERGIPIELHHRIARTIPPDRLTELLGVEAIDGDLPIAGHALHRLLDIAKDGWARVGLLPYLDLLLMRRAGVEFPRVLRMAEGAGVGAACASVLLAFDEIWGGELSAAERAACRGLESPLVRLARLRDCAGDALWRIRYTPRWQRRIRRWVLGRVH